MVFRCTAGARVSLLLAEALSSMDVLSWAASPAVHSQCGVAIGAIFRCGYNSGNRLPKIMYTAHAIMRKAVRPKWRSYKVQSAAAKAI